ncbi:universal stress protein [Roseovarius faecimaris]|uniref:Universal stress protein n=1 Tax=Roseovarius faecimaris TaxID=2494550 RepID=A0A6I6ITE0_9RHOB|nr:universal stress protein [Roseovarius faecimaris]QGX99472.1 universal stress protein [Roseovarius faecimaris]
MTYSSLYCVLTDPALVKDTLRHAIAAAQTHDAHLDVLCLGVDQTQTGYYYAGASAIVLQDSIERAQDLSAEIDAAARAILDGESLLWAIETGMTQLISLNRLIAARARFSDLVILPQPYGEDRGIELETITEATLFEGSTPALILPAGSAPEPRFNNVVIAWNESAEALNATRAAMPLLKAADKVHVVVIDPPTHGPNRSDPGGLLSQYLARHGVTVQVEVLSKTLPRISDVLSRHVADIGADLVVMGAYGHSRVREAVFGGATRDLLETSTVPVLMAH